MSLAIALHTLAAVIWVGGMFFAYQVLRPVAAELLQAPERLRLWSMVFARFFPWVRLAIGLLLLSGFWIIRAKGGFTVVGWHVHLMLTIGLVMFGLYAYLDVGLYRHLLRAVEAQDWPTGGAYLGRIRRIVGTNLILGLLTVVIASGGRHLG